MKDELKQLKEMNQKWNRWLKWGYSKHEITRTTKRSIEKIENKKWYLDIEKLKDGGVWRRVNGRIYTFNVAQLLPDAGFFRSVTLVSDQLVDEVVVFENGGKVIIAKQDTRRVIDQTLRQGH